GSIILTPPFSETLGPSPVLASRLPGSADLPRASTPATAAHARPPVGPREPTRRAHTATSAVFPSVPTGRSWHALVPTRRLNSSRGCTAHAAATTTPKPAATVAGLPAGNSLSGLRWSRCAS